MGRNTYIGISKQSFVDYTSESNCVNVQDQTLNRYPNFVYSQFACRQNELVEYIVRDDTCNCVIDPIFATNERNCTFNDSCCVANATMNYEIPECRLPCDYTYYTNAVSYSTFPSGELLQYLANSRNSTADVIQKSFLSVNVYFEGLTETTSVTEYSYPLQEVVSEFGGNLGLFIGASVISLLEIIMLFLDEVKWCCCCSKKFQEQIETFDDRLICIEVINNDD